MRSASVRTEPSLAWKVSATASTTFGLTSELPCTANVAPLRMCTQSPFFSSPYWPLPVHCAERPLMSITPTCRLSRP